MVLVAVALAAAAIVSDDPPSLAHSEAKGVIKERMDLMQGLKDTVKAVTPMFKGKAPYEKAKVKAAGKHIHAHAGADMTELFPKDSLQHPSDALPKIWDDWPDFTSRAKDLKSLGKDLARTAGKSAPEGVTLSPEVAKLLPATATFKKIVKTCTSCHETYRKPW
ncbi:c-type cytochrome [Rhodobium gokarnense]|uniref:Cytochrome c556 n=1 Tax=Rhodobium gokarnense TaxID=364296 RepID=A0ABT3H8Z7_9HYPH|nr:cytochrome c [Rhodobium gokarnense]MCW2306860.1 cytochrome c556 [Rhodobium gokarnense]